MSPHVCICELGLWILVYISNTIITYYIIENYGYIEIWIRLKDYLTLIFNEDSLNIATWITEISKIWYNMTKRLKGI